MRALDNAFRSMNLPLGDKPVIGIVGGIGAGKSTVAAEFAVCGCTLIDGDAIGYELLGKSEVQAELRRQWGDGIFREDGGVDREALGKKVFGAPDALERLNRIMHPRIRRRIAEQIAAAQTEPNARAIVLDAAVLFEAGWDDMCTHLVFVRAPDELRRQRACEARGWNDATWTQREKSQISLDMKANRCDDTIDNSSTVSCLREQVRLLLDQIVPAADCPR